MRCILLLNLSALQISWKTENKRTEELPPCLCPLEGSAYLTEPVMPSANCFCSTKKTIIVGREQNRTPSISMP